MTLKAIIFDVDGTLADTEHNGHRVAFNRAFKEQGLDWHWDEQRYASLLAITGGKERLAYYLSTQSADTVQLVSDQAVPDHSIALSNRKLNQHCELIAALHQSKTRHYKDLLREGNIELRAGVDELLQCARAQGLRLAIATTTTAANVTALFKYHSGRARIDWFECIAAGDIVGNKKPAPDIYHYALQQLALPAHHCVAVEDSANGLNAALAANLATLVVTNRYTRHDKFDAAQLILTDYGSYSQPFTVQQGHAGSHSRVTPELLQDLLPATNTRNSIS